MIVLFTDFGLHGPYTGQMKAVLAFRGSVTALSPVMALPK